LTAELPDVGTDGALHRNLIRADGAARPGQGIAFKAPSLRYQSTIQIGICRGNIKEILEGSTLMGPSKHRARNAANCGHPFAAGFGRLMMGAKLTVTRLTVTSLAVALFFGLTASASAQGAVRSVHGDWQIRCDTPPGAQGEQCALIQSVVAEDRSNAGLTVIVLKTADQKSKLMRVVAPLGVLLPSGLGLKLDNQDVGRAGFVRCLPNGCVAEVVMDDKLLGQLRTAKTATFIIFETPEEGIGFPLSLNGIGEGYDKLP
jgi:invasion protein IalB